ncbi:hypothetical protein AMATHDRAFT_41521 [Amanita thiersii Skay4041]|uniref:RRM domain-containing protein n=1 Tax=Amanita thiersii Skay4041 TaxID=703135 RepID=A0A2A9NNY1_9AGAR|nr:hypothetical protein AMATHDRAFT_41521 [Amanita thiersii Skay4041]
MTHGEAGKLKEAGERAREKTDKRNMYLLREAALLLPSERRTNSYNTRRKLLKSNPSLYVSKTRLSIWQVSFALSAEELADPGGRPGDHDADKGHEEDNDVGITENPSKCANYKPKLKKLAHHKGGRVKQAKIVRQADRADPVMGKGRSRGYGFVEMHTHADALRVLRWANNNPDVHLLTIKWWREELESLIKVEKGKSKIKEGKAGEEEGGARLKRLMTELEKEKQKEGMDLRGGKEEDDGDGDGENKRNRGTLIVECSIENVQVVQRRNAIQKNKATRKDKSHQGTTMLDDCAPPRKGPFSKGRISQHRNEGHGKRGKRIRGPDDGVMVQQPSPKKKLKMSKPERN